MLFHIIKNNEPSEPYWKNNCPKGYKELSLLLLCPRKHLTVLPGIYLTRAYPSVAFSHFLFPGWEHMKTASVLYAAFQAKPENTASVGTEEDAEEEDRED